MKRMLCILCAALLLAACTARPAAGTQPTEEPAHMTFVSAEEIAGYAGFSDVLSAKVLDGTKNRNLSPISVYLALAMAAEGASGETQSDMLKLLGCSSIEELRGVCGAMLETLSLDSEESVLAFADSVWMADRDGMTFRDAYLKTLSDVYRSEANAVRFGTKEAAEQIADWIKEHTRGKIDVSPEALPFSADTVAVLINAVYLKVAWSDAFYEGATASGAFDGPDGRLTVDYMHRRADNSSIVQGDGFLRYSLPLCQFGRMTFVLPDEGVSLSDLLGSPEKLHTLLCGGESIEAHVDVKLPKFAFQDQIDLSDALIALGAGRAFSSEADFSGMFADRCSIAISDVLQGSYIGVDEKGVEAAAYTLVAVGECMEMPRELPEIDFHLTRPFLYVIESRDGTVLFIGTVTSPSPAKG